MGSNILNYLDFEKTKQFFLFCVKRQEIYHLRRVVKAEPPWTNDPILANYRFTNVIREQDKGTIFAEKIHNHAASQPYKVGRVDAFRNLLFNLLVYRLFGHPDTYDTLGYTTVKNWQRNEFVGALKARRAAGEQVFSSSYNVFPCHHLGYSDRLDLVNID